MNDIEVVLVPEPLFTQLLESVVATSVVDINDPEAVRTASNNAMHMFYKVATSAISGKLKRDELDQLSISEIDRNYTLEK